MNRLLIFFLFNLSFSYSNEINLFEKLSEAKITKQKKTVLDSLKKFKHINNIELVFMANIVNQEKYIFNFKGIKKSLSFIYENGFFKVKKGNQYGCLLKKGKYFKGIFIVNNITYELDHLSDSTYIIKEINQSNKKLEGCDFPIISDSLRNLKKGSINKLMSTSSDCKVRVLVVYTSSASSERGGTEDINSDIKLAIEFTNDAFSNSNIGNQEIELVRTIETSYTEVAGRTTVSSKWGGTYPIPTDLHNLILTSDGNMDDIHDLRDYYKADIVVIIVDNNFSGTAREIYADFDEAFCLVDADAPANYLTLNYTFPHELGHLFGCRHDIATDPSTIPFADGHGFCYPSDNWRTIMSYPNFGSCSNRLLYWSNPNVSYNGDAMGDVQSNNAKVIDDTNVDMKNLILTSDIYIHNINETIGSYNIADLLAISELTIDSEYISEPNSEVTFRAGETIKIKDGFHAKAGSEFHAYIDDVNCASSSKALTQDEPSQNLSGNTSISISPNPTNSSINIEYVVAESGLVSLELYDNIGSKMLTLIDNKDIIAGTYTTTQDLSNFASGQYLLVLKVNGEVTTKQVIKL